MHALQVVVEDDEVVGVPRYKRDRFLWRTAAERDAWLAAVNAESTSARIAYCAAVSGQAQAFFFSVERIDGFQCDAWLAAVNAESTSAHIAYCAAVSGQALDMVLNI